MLPKAAKFNASATRSDTTMRSPTTAPATLLRTRLLGRITLALAVPVFLLTTIGIATLIVQMLGGAQRAEPVPRDTVQRFFKAWGANDEPAMMIELHAYLRMGFEGLVLRGLTTIVIDQLGVEPLDATFQEGTTVGDEATVLTVFVASKGIWRLASASASPSA